MTSTTLLFEPPKCLSKGHTMVVLESSRPEGHRCNQCQLKFATKSLSGCHHIRHWRWRCLFCNDDYCFKCRDPPPASYIYQYPLDNSDTNNTLACYWECSVCTLVNPLSAHQCGACGISREATNAEEAKNSQEIILLAASAVNNLPNNHAWDPLHLGSFGVSSPVEAQLCRLTLTRDVGYDLSPEEHKVLLEERGIRLPFIEGDKVIHQEKQGEVVCSHMNDENKEEVEVVYDNDMPDTTSTDTTTTDTTYTYVESSDRKQLFPFDVTEMKRRSPGEIWLRSDAASFVEKDRCSPTILHTAEMGTNTSTKKRKQTNPSGREQTCCICRDHKAELYSGLCRGQVSSVKTPPPSKSARTVRTTTATTTTTTTTATCDVLFCGDCLGGLCETVIKGSRCGVIRPMLCPAPSCRRRLPMEVWHRHVSLVSLLQYVRTPRQVLSMRCPECHMVEELFPQPCLGLQDRREAYERLLKLLSKVGKEAEAGASSSPSTASRMTDLTRVWHQFSIGQVTASETISGIRQIINGGTDEESSATSEEVALAGPSLDDMSQVLSLVVDVERRAALTLAFLSEHPLIELPCCDVPVCFRCKVKGHHKGETCEKRQEAEMGIEVQHCPHCKVPTVRSEGCDHIVCQCGRHWRWVSTRKHANANANATRRQPRVQAPTRTQVARRPPQQQQVGFDAAAAAVAAMIERLDGAGVPGTTPAGDDPWNAPPPAAAPRHYPNEVPSSPRAAAAAATTTATTTTTQSPARSPTMMDGDSGGGMREMRLEDALLYLDDVKRDFGDRINEFLAIMKGFKTREVDTPGVIARVSVLFRGRSNLILGFNKFLADEDKISLEDLENNQS